MIESVHPVFKVMNELIESKRIGRLVISAVM